MVLGPNKRRRPQRDGQRATDHVRPTVQQVRVDHCGRHVHKAEQLLHAKENKG
jgi:hypothetical protein